MTRRQRQKGAALIIVLGIIAVVTITAGAMSYTASQQMHAAKITREMLKARLIAESGLNKAYNEVKGDFSKISSCAQSGTLGDGTYTVRARTAIGGNPNRAQIISEGRCGIGKATVSADLENIPLVTGAEGSGSDFFEFMYDLLVGGWLKFAGNPDAGFTKIFSNETLTVSGNPHLADLVQFFSASIVDIKTKKIEGKYEKYNNQPRQVIATEALTAAINTLKAYAQKHGAVYASGHEIPENPPGGIAYCTGSSDGWSKKGKGCFIFEGEVRVQGSGIDIESVNGFPALIVLSPSDVHFTADALIYGAILIPNGSFTVNGHAEIHGVILVGQAATINGTADLYLGEGGRGFALPSEESTTDNVVITAWH
jgi:hypothetical protein